ncbi:polysaccharide biosynthesis protein [Candidatus Saccharibacteria bacterium]|nr:polysaccharide biosynthesis protein [Candidatus Saccharibacteria bacterium]
MKSKFKKRVTLLNTLSSLVLQITLIINGFLVPKLILDAFGSDVNGLISSLTKFLQYIALVDGGIAGVLTAKLYRPLARKDTEKINSVLASAKKFYRKIGYIFMIYALVLSVVYPLCFNTGFSFMYVMTLTLILSISLITQYMMSLTYKTLLNADKKIYVTATTQAFISIAEIVLAMISIKIYPEIHLLKLLTGAVYIIQPIVYTHYIKKHYTIDTNVRADSISMKGRWDGFAINTAAFVHSGTDVAVLTIFTNLATVSVYSVYALVTSGIKNLINSLVSSLNPTLGHAYARENFGELKQKLNIYEYVVFTLVFLIFSVAGLLITPFVSIYTAGLTDANYHQPLFGILLVISEALYLLKFPHLNLAYSANKFRDISIPAFVEAGLNIVISVALVPFLGIVGVAIGTIVAMAYRLVFHVYYTSKIIPRWRQWFFYRKLIIFTIASEIGITLCLLLPDADGTIISWIWHAVVYAFIIGVLLVGVSLVFFRDELSYLKNYLRRK